MRETEAAADAAASSETYEKHSHIFREYAPPEAVNFL